MALYTTGCNEQDLVERIMIADKSYDHSEATCDTAYEILKCGENVDDVEPISTTRIPVASTPTKSYIFMHVLV